MLFGQHFDGELPQKLKHVFLRQFLNCCNKTIGTFMFKNQNDGATLRVTPFTQSSQRLVGRESATLWFKVKYLFL